MLSKQDILDAINKGELEIEPLIKDNLGPDSLDVRLGNKLLISRNINNVIDPKNPLNYWEKIEINKGFMLMPGQFVLGSTMEKLRLGKNIAAQIEGRSSIGRLGIMVHVTAGVVHAGFGIREPSSITLEIYSVNPNPVMIYSGMKIAQLAFFRLEQSVDKGYDEINGSRYVNQKEPLPPKPI